MTRSARDRQKQKVYHVYVLELEGGNFYVGSASRLPARMREHFVTKYGKSSAWCSRYKPVGVAHSQAIFGTVHDAVSLEDQIALGLAKSIGLDRVRGGKLSGNADSTPWGWNRFLDGVQEIKTNQLVGLNETELEQLIGTQGKQSSLF